MGTSELPRDLAQARSRFQAWRARRQVGERIPHSLWGLAIRLAGSHGVSQTSAALRVDYYTLKKRLEETRPGRPAVSAAGPAFIELQAPAAVGKQCWFELDNNAGTRMRVQLLGYDATDIDTLARTLWNGA